MYLTTNQLVFRLNNLTNNPTSRFAYQIHHQSHNNNNKADNTATNMATIQRIGNPIEKKLYRRYNIKTSYNQQSFSEFLKI